MQPRRALPALVLLALGTTLAADTHKLPDLPSLLAGMDRASRLYLDTALRFTCDETITQAIYKTIPTGHYQYIFVYDEREGFKDYRMEAGGEDRPPVDLAKAGFRALRRSYFWVLSFLAERQENHRYAIVGVEDWAGTRTILVRFEPIPPYREGINDWFGTAWVDPSSYQILKVEAMRADQKLAWEQLLEDQKAWVHLLEERKALHEDSPEQPSKRYPIQNVSTEFKWLKNGMRFPSRSRVVQTQYELSRTGPEPAKLFDEETVQTYRHYKFYGVRTAEEVRSILDPKSKRK